MLMFSSQNQVRISLDFPPRDRVEPILPGHGNNHRVVGSSELEGDLVVVEENLMDRRREIQIPLHQVGFLVSKLKLLMFEGQKPWWIQRCEKLFSIH